MHLKQHGRDLRKGRTSIPNQVYLVTTVTHARIPLFNNFTAGRIVVNEFRHSDALGNSLTHAYVVMPDHFHWLMQPEARLPLSAVVGKVKSHAARLVNHLNGTRGKTVWQRGFHDHALRKDASVVAVARYIVANPLRAGLAKRPGDYPLWDAAWL
jgi:REP element-mobilizing transposase RayT